MFKGKRINITDKEAQMLCGSPRIKIRILYAPLFHIRYPERIMEKKKAEKLLASGTQTLTCYCVVRGYVK